MQGITITDSCIMKKRSQWRDFCFIFLKVKAFAGKHKQLYLKNDEVQEMYALESIKNNSFS